MVIDAKRNPAWVARAWQRVAEKSLPAARDMWCAPGADPPAGGPPDRAAVSRGEPEGWDGEDGPEGKTANQRWPLRTCIPS